MGMTDAEVVALLRDIAETEITHIASLPKPTSVKSDVFRARLAALTRGAEAIEEVARLREALKAMCDQAESDGWRFGLYADTLAQARAALSGERKGGCDGSV
jgi:hypothetical protein